jgi:NADH-quinone oxidoreductase subunit I
VTTDQITTPVTQPKRAPFGVGLLKGLGVTIKTMMRPASTQQYPHVRPELPPRTRGVIALMDENCTVCMLCARECPDWCIYIDSHKETVPPAKEGGRARTRNVLDRFAIDFSLCMYCGICVEVCPFDALFWSPEFEYAEYEITGLLHEMERLREWADTVPPPPPLDEGADVPAEVGDAIAKKNQELEAAQVAGEQAEIEAAKPADAGAKAAPAAARAAEPEIEIEAGEIDQETYDQLIAEGKSERIARSKAKAAYVRKARKAAREAAAAEGGAEATADAAAADAGAAAAPDKPKLADVHVEGAGEIDQEVYDQLIAEGKSERIARAKAKAAWVKKQKQKKLDEGEA